MKLLSPLIAELRDGSLHFHCPGCQDAHVIPVSGEGRPNWGYNGNPEAPTFTPSILVRSGHYVPGHQGDQCYCNWPDKDEFPEIACRICHSFVTDGRIQFLGDSTHALAGQTVPLPAIPERPQG